MNQQNGDLPPLPTLLYQVPAGMGPGHPHHPGATRPQGWEHDHVIYTHVLNRGPLGVRGTADIL